MDEWDWYFYYWYVPGRGPQLLLGTDEEVAIAAGKNPDAIVFASQEEPYGAPGKAYDDGRMKILWADRI